MSVETDLHNRIAALEADLGLATILWKNAVAENHSLRERMRSMEANHDPHWPFEVLEMIKEELGEDCAPMFFSDRIRRMHITIASLNAKLDRITTDRQHL